jgi:hypothetical protein
MTVIENAATRPEQGLKVLPGSAVQYAVLVLILLFGFGIRLYDLKDAPLDFHPTRQLRSAIIARGLYYGWDTSASPDQRALAQNIASSMEIYEPTIFEGLVALTYRAIGQELLWVSRAWCALFWTVGGLALFALGRRFAPFWAVLAGLLFYFFLPFSIQASRSFQPDPFMVMWMILAWWAGYRWSETGRWSWAVLAGLTGGMALLIKAVAALPAVGALFALVLFAWGFKKAIRSPQAWVLTALLVLPSLVYYSSLGARSGSFLSFWTLSLSRLVLTSHFYAEWLGIVGGLLGFGSILVALLGVLLAQPRARALLIGAWIGYFVYGMVFPYQMTTHEYYHLSLIALVSLSLVPAAAALFEKLSVQPLIWRIVAILILAFTAGYNMYAARSALVVRDYAGEVIAWTRMGQALPDNGQIIALTSEYGNRLKYYGWHNLSAIWPTGADLQLSSLAGKDALDTTSYFQAKTAGKDYFLITAFGELEAQPQLKSILAHYPVLKKGDGFVLYDLRK